jgi:DNA-binding response OmpR family regulator
MPLILVIDDEVHIRTLLREMLERSGYEVMDAPDGAAGIRLYRENPADLVITDIIMPKKEGLETITDLRIEFPEVKIIAMSGGGTVGPESYLQIAEGFGALRIFAKPFKMNELLAAIQELLG